MLKPTEKSWREKAIEAATHLVKAADYNGVTSADADTSILDLLHDFAELLGERAEIAEDILSDAAHEAKKLAEDIRDCPDAYGYGEAA